MKPNETYVVRCLESREEDHDNDGRVIGVRTATVDLTRRKLVEEAGPLE